MGVKRGITLLELLIVLVILGAILSVSVYYYNLYSKRISIEEDVYKIYALMMKARTSAFTEKEKRYIKLITTDNKTIVMDNDTDTSNGYLESVSTVNKFLIRGSISPYDFFRFDRYGFSDTQGSVRYSGEDIGAVYDCVVVSWTRIAIGKYDGSSCKAK